MTDPDVRDAIMRATYEALREEGYSDLTAQAIADRTDRSKSALFYHYDSREALVADFIGYLLEGFEARVARTRDYPPVERLAAMVDWFLSGPDDDQVAFHAAMLELRAQAPYNDVYREKLRQSDDRLREAVEEILEAGIEDGSFVDHDTERMAALLLAAFDGARIRQLTLDREEYLDAVRTETAERLLVDVLAPGVAFPAEPTLEFPRDERLVGDGPGTNAVAGSDGDDCDRTGDEDGRTSDDGDRTGDDGDDGGETAGERRE